MIPSREWTEADILALPPGEQREFDRKRADILSGADWRESLAKPLCAFANSGGGSLILGVADDGSLLGIDPKKGSTSTKDWLEQVIPKLLSHPLEAFRVHEVLPSTPSSIPPGKILLVVEVADSALAPHQTTQGRIYYYREGSHSVPAPHFYLETLRNRLTGPALASSLVRATLLRALWHEGGLFAHIELTFYVRNVGRVAAYKWDVSWRVEFDVDDSRHDDFIVDPSRFPPWSGGRSSGIRIDDTILSGGVLSKEDEFGFILRPASSSEADLRAELSLMSYEKIAISHGSVSEVSPSEEAPTPLHTVLPLEEFLKQLLAKLPPKP